MSNRILLLPLLIGLLLVALVNEGQAILRKVGIDPIYGKENLVWAPFKISQQHGVESLTKVVEKLRALDRAGADYNDFVKALKKLDELRFLDNSEAIMRMITKNEYIFLKRVENLIGKSLHSYGLSPSVKVEEMEDGGMGSLRFEITTDGISTRRLGEVFAQGEFNDEDGVPVSFTINMDSNGQLYELDLWRVDFMPLKRFPMEQVELKILADTA